MSELYVLTDAILTPADTVLAQVGAALEAGAKWVQWRNKNGNSNLNCSAAPDLNLISNLNSICAKFEAKFIIDDDVFLARKIGASGVHLGKDDIGVDAAREILGSNAIIGVSCYASIERALAAQNAGADYVAFGAMYPSATKPLAPLCPPQIVHEAKKTSQNPRLCHRRDKHGKYRRSFKLKPRYDCRRQCGLEK